MFHFLAIDCGNTRLKWALYAFAEDAPLNITMAPIAGGAVRLEDIDTLFEQNWRTLPQPNAMLGCNVAAELVRLRVNDLLRHWGAPPRWLTPLAAEAGVKNGYDFPARLGADRWAALIGARARLLASDRAERPAVVVALGTAVTVDALSQEGSFLGGFILPGYGMMLRALEAGTAGLHVPTGRAREFPTNTSDALASGGAYAISGAIERMCAHLRTRCGAEPALFITGGAAPKVAPVFSRPFEGVEALIFEGLLRIAQERGWLDLALDTGRR